MAEHVIEINNLTKYYGKHLGVADISFAVERGEIFGFIGPNGAGKSTTIRTLLALIFPTSGSATIFGKDCIKYAPELANDIGYLPSEVFYYDGMKVIDLLRYAAGFYKKDCMPRINQLCDRLDLDKTRKIEDLSYGNKKKVGIVQGLLHSPQLILLDEPTAGLDPLIQQSFFELLREENKKGVSILFSSHILSEVQKMCSRVGIVKQGKLISLQSMTELREQSYKKVRVSSKQPLDGILSGIDGVSGYEIGPSGVTFLFRGDINAIVAKLGALPLSDLNIEEPTLEEVFLHYYE